MSNELFDQIKRQTKVDDQQSLFEIGQQSIDEFWWAMPSFDMGDGKPTRKLTVNFQTVDDFIDFQKKLGCEISFASDSIWWPIQSRLKSREFVWKGKPSPTKYPVYIPSKGRFDIATTPGLLDQAGVDYFLVVEPQEADDYRSRFGDSVIELPFSNLGQGSIPARNWIWQHAKEHEHQWHWIIDDNVNQFARTHGNRRLSVEQSSAPLRIVEDFVDRYQNIAFAGLAHRQFASDRTAFAPITFNTRIYSVTLINTDLPYRWRGRYNEDTDICLRALKDGWSTVLFRSMLMNKTPTSRGDGKSGTKGGNTDNVYNVNDYRLKFAQSLQEQHPDCVEIVWRFNRWHHLVDYSQFKNNRPILKQNITKTKLINEYDLELHRGNEPQQ